jgi:hypothetical protein
MVDGYEISACADSRPTLRLTVDEPSLRFKERGQLLISPAGAIPSNALGGTRTHDPGIRNPLLYPAELRAQMYGFKDGKVNPGWRKVNWGTV